ncbi:MAG: aspartate-semialdehyde dehydrogenase [Polyangiaceae bacterium]|nr:aspartate-semialdehyde dehydrogenase [Polyangiaceae bacterium]
MSCVVAVVGATGVVGREMLRTLEQRNFPATEVRALASPRSAGRRIPFRGGEIEVQPVSPEAFEGVRFALFSAGAAASREIGPVAASKGAVVIDNSSAWRMDPEVPLVVPEVNMAAAKHRPRGIIANPNCSTIQMVVALKPLHDAAKITHVVVSTYQATSGKGHAAMEELIAQTTEVGAGKGATVKVFPGQIVGNLLMDWKPGPDDYSEEELKMVNETRKIMGDANMGVSPTTVRVPVITSHSESVHVQFARPMFAEEAKRLLEHAPGVVLVSSAYAPGNHPQPIHVAGTDAVYVGRVRNDLAVKGAINMWIVADNLRKGAALNAVQIAEELLKTEPAA